MLSISIFILKKQITQIGDASYLWVFFLCFLGNSTIFLPAPSLMAAMSFSLILNPVIVIIVASLGASIGEMIGYTFGAVSKDALPKFYNLFVKVLGWIKYDWLLLFIVSVLPLPLFDLAGVYLGGKKKNIAMFFLVCYLGKFIKTSFYVGIINFLASYGSVLYAK